MLFRSGLLGYWTRRLIKGIPPTKIATAITSSSEHLHLLSHDFGGVTLDAILAGPLAGTQTSLNIYRTPFAQILTCNFGQPAKHHHTMPLCFLAALACLAIAPVK